MVLYEKSSIVYSSYSRITHKFKVNHIKPRGVFLIGNEAGISTMVIKHYESRTSCE